jgi:predicted Zn-dependent peptidase
MATISITFGAGSRVEHNSKYPKGMAHVQEHLRFKGTHTYSSKEMARQIALQGGDWNAFTCEDVVQYYVELPEENIEKGIELLAEIAFKPTFPEDEFKKEIEVICQEVRSYEDDMGYEVRQKLYSMVFNNALSSPIVGSEDSVKSITRQHLLDFNKEFYFPQGALIVEASNNSHQHLIEKHFGLVDETLVFPPKPDKVEYAPSFEHEFVKEGHQQHTISVAFGDENIRAAVKNNRVAAGVFNNIFGGGADARLFMKVREDLGLVYGIYSGFSNYFDGTLFKIGTSTEPENSKRVLSAIDEVIQDMLNNPPSDEEMLKSKNVIKSGYYRTLDTSAGVAANVLNEEVYKVSGGSEFLAELDRVSVQDVVEIAKTVFAANKYVVIGKGE